MVRTETYEVYRITCSNGVYIGVTKRRPSERWYRHTQQLREGKHPCKPLQAAYDSGEIIEKPQSLVLFNTPNKYSALMAERYFQLMYKEQGLLINTTITKEPVQKLCKHGNKFKRLCKSRIYTLCETS